MRTVAIRQEHRMRDWQIAVVAGFAALTFFEIAIDRRNTMIDRSVFGAGRIEHVIVVPNNVELIREMLMHD